MVAARSGRQSRAPGHFHKLLRKFHCVGKKMITRSWRSRETAVIIRFQVLQRNITRGVGQNIGKRTSIISTENRIIQDLSDTSDFIMRDPCVLFHLADVKINDFSGVLVYLVYLNNHVMSELA